MVLAGQPLALRAFELPAGLTGMFDLKAKMMDAGNVWAMRAHVRRLGPLGVQNRDVDVAVGQEHRTVWAAAQFLEAKGRFVELGNLGRLLCRQRNMPDPC